MIHVKTDEIYGKNPIINANDLRSHIINIDSRFRKSQLEPPTDFQFEFAHTYKNVIHARIVSVEIPAVVYNFSRAKKNTMFRLDATDYTGVQHHLTISIPDGNYTTSQLLETIQQELNGIRDMYGMFFRITMDQRTNKVTIHHDGTAAPPCPVGPSHCPIEFGLVFVMVGLEDRRYDFGLGYNLGFTEQMYVVKTASITTESIISTAGDSYFLLAMDDMYTVEHKTEDTYIQCLVNLTDGGDGLINKVFTPEYRKNLSNSMKGRVLSEETKAKLRTYRLGVPNSPEARAKISKANKGRRNSDALMELLINRKGKKNPAFGITGQKCKNFKGFIEVFKNGVYLGKYEGIRHCAESFGVEATKVSAVINGRRNHTGGYTFKRI